MMSFPEPDFDLIKSKDEYGDNMYSTEDGYKALKVDGGWLVFGPEIRTQQFARNLRNVKHTIVAARNGEYR